MLTLRKLHLNIFEESSMDNDKCHRYKYYNRDIIETSSQIIMIVGGINNEV